MRTRLSHGAEPAIPSRATTTPSNVSTAETSTICGNVSARLGRGLLRTELAGSAVHGVGDRGARGLSALARPEEPGRVSKVDDEGGW
jgi:hypothetical protein